MAHVAQKRTRAEAKFPSHYDLPVSKIAKVKTTDGTFTINVFRVGKDWHGKAEYKFEVIFPDPECFGTTTKKFSSIADAVKRATEDIHESVARGARERAEAKKSPERKALEKLGKEVAFFKEHGGGVVGHAMEGALSLAKAEKIAKELDWTYDWTHDEEEYQLGDNEDAPPFEVLAVLLRDENGEVVGSLGGIGMTGNARKDRDYGRVVEAELAYEAAKEKGLL